MTPAIDLIEIIAARGNTTLNSTVQLTVSLRNDINEFGKRMSDVMEGEPSAQQSTSDSTKRIIDDMKALLARIEDAVPLISLALTTSGANLSASLPSTVSPSRLLQASAFLQAGDTEYELNSTREVQIGPSFSLKLYTIFEGHSRQSKDPNISNITWQETYARAILEVIRMPMQADLGHNEVDQRNHKINYFYHFRVTENLDDNRYHEDLTSSRPKRDAQGFIRGASRDIPVHNIARLFFSASGRLLNIEEARTPVLVLKINHALQGPSATIRRIFEESFDLVINDPELTGSNSTDRGTESSPDDLEWLALEMWSQDDDDDSSSEPDDFDTASEQSSSAQEEGIQSRPTTSGTDGDTLAMQMQLLEVSKPSLPPNINSGPGQADLATLSLLEYILRLSALQTSEQQSIMNVSDERISLFLRDDNAQSRNRSDKETDAVRRQSNDRFDTPASSVYYEDFIPGTNVKSKRNRRSRHATPDSASKSSLPLHHTPKPKPKADVKLDTPRTQLATETGVPGTFGSRRWQRFNDKELFQLVSDSSPLGSKNPKHMTSLSDLDTAASRSSNGTNGFSSRLRHSAMGPDSDTNDPSPSSPRTETLQIEDTHEEQQQSE